jgi:hypothetical protein
VRWVSMVCPPVFDDFTPQSLGTVAPYKKFSRQQPVRMVIAGPAATDWLPIVSVARTTQVALGGLGVENGPIVAL